jgi:drug/metabolite transporter (DMT)-like permease
MSFNSGILCGSKFSQGSLVTSESLCEQKKGIAILSAGVLIISVDALLVRLAHTDSWNVVFWRGLFMFISMGFILLIRHGREAASAVTRGGWAAAFCAILFGTGGTLFVTSIMHTSVANTVVILSSSPLFAALFTRTCLKEKVPLRTWIAIGIGITGVTLVFSGSLGGGGLLGDLIAILAACNVGGNLTILRSYKVLERLPLICMGGFIMALIAFPFAAPFNLHLNSYLTLGVMGLVQMPFSLIMIAKSTRYLPSPEVSLFLLVETILSPIWVWIFLKEQPPNRTLLGAALIIPVLMAHSWLGMREEKHS